MIENDDFRIPTRAYPPRIYDMENCRYVLAIAARMLAIYEQTFAIACGLTELDILAVPGSVGAMENRGLITISTTVVSISPVSAAPEKLFCSQLIAHGLAHQFFGNIITAEKTARETLAHIVSAPWQGFVADQMQKALAFDPGGFSHALEMPIDWKKAPSLDDLTYGKGQDLEEFLQQRAYGSADPDDLWAIPSKSSDPDTVAPSPFSPSASEDTVLHPLFLEILTRISTMKEARDVRSKTIEVPLEFCRINSGFTSLYRVAYPVSGLRKFREEVGKGTLSVEDRIGLVSETAALAFAGHLFHVGNVIAAPLQESLHSEGSSESISPAWSAEGTSPQARLATDLPAPGTEAEECFEGGLALRGWRATEGTWWAGRRRTGRTSVARMGGSAPCIR
ncbi:hypothetical protein JHW43_006071 [Diplocarpon mali]|nr:hypothetical protein JHW43_006071 [Diplocarpon mali]